MAQYRNIVEEPQFAASANKVDPQRRALDEIQVGVTFMLSRAPHLGHQTDRTGVFATRTYSWSRDIDALVWYYSFTEEDVYLEDLRVAEDDG